MHTIIAALAALIIASTPVSTILPPPWVAPEPTATPTLIWSKTPIAPVATSTHRRRRSWASRCGASWCGCRLLLRRRCRRRDRRNEQAQ